MAEYNDFRNEYRGMTDQQLLRVAYEGELVVEAEMALKVEMSQRGLTSDMVARYQPADARPIKRDDKSDPNERTILGVGFRLFGRSYLSQQDKERRIQVRTKFFSVQWLPIFPVASYRYAHRERGKGLVKVDVDRVIGRVPLNWSQVRRIWLVHLGWNLAGVVAVVLYLAWRDGSWRW